MCCGLREGERGRFHCRYTVKMNMSTIAVMNMLSRLSLIVLLYFSSRWHVIRRLNILLLLSLAKNIHHPTQRVSHFFYCIFGCCWPFFRYDSSNSIEFIRKKKGKPKFYSSLETNAGKICHPERDKRKTKQKQSWAMMYALHLSWMAVRRVHTLNFV